MDPGTMGGLLGTFFGGVGGAVGTYFSIKNTSGPRERAFMIRASVVGWVAVAVFLAGLILLPNPYRFLLFLPYVLALPISIVWVNKRQAKIRAEEHP